MKKTFKNGKTYVSHQYLSFGDYDNSCAIERANVKVLREAHPGFESYGFSKWDQGQYLEYNETTKFHEWVDILPESEIVELYCGYGSTAIWIREDIDEENEYTTSLENYPCLDDDVVSEVEFEMEGEYLKDCFSDIERHFPQATRDALELTGIETFDQECYRAAMDKSNTYFEVQAGGNGYIDFERLAPYYETELYAHKPEIKIIADMIQALENKPDFPLSFYNNAEDMLDHRDATGQGITTEEAREILKYAAELERQIETVVP